MAVATLPAAKLGSHRPRRTTRLARQAVCSAIYFPPRAARSSRRAAMTSRRRAEYSNACPVLSGWAAPRRQRLSRPASPSPDQRPRAQPRWQSRSRHRIRNRPREQAPRSIRSQSLRRSRKRAPSLRLGQQAAQACSMAHRLRFRPARDRGLSCKMACTRSQSAGRIIASCSPG